MVSGRLVQREYSRFAPERSGFDSPDVHWPNAVGTTLELVVQVRLLPPRSSEVWLNGRAPVVVSAILVGLNLGRMLEGLHSMNVTTLDTFVSHLPS